MSLKINDEEVVVPDTYEIKVLHGKSDTSPNVSINLHVNTFKDASITMKYIERGYVQLTDRIGDPVTKEYKIHDDVIIMYDSKSKIVGILLQDKDLSSDPAEEAYAELTRFLDIAKDHEAMQAFRLLAWNWAHASAGFGVMANIDNLLEGDQVFVASQDVIDLINEGCQDEEDLDSLEDLIDEEDDEE